VSPLPIYCAVNNRWSYTSTAPVRPHDTQWMNLLSPSIYAHYFQYFPICSQSLFFIISITNKTFLSPRHHDLTKPFKLLFHKDTLIKQTGNSGYPLGTVNTQQHKTYPYLHTPCSRVLLDKLNGFAASQEIPCILWNLKDYYRTHKYKPKTYPRIS
jgi:hypothetical protein